MDARIFNASVIAGLLMVFFGLETLFSWPVACVAVGAILIWGSFRAAALAMRPSRGDE